MFFGTRTVACGLLSSIGRFGRCGNKNPPRLQSSCTFIYAELIAATRQVEHIKPSLYSLLSSIHPQYQTVANETSHMSQISSYEGPALPPPHGGVPFLPNSSEEQVWFFVCVSFCTVISGTFLLLRLYTKLCVVRQADPTDCSFLSLTQASSILTVIQMFSS